ncbi:MAG: hypothetical protein IJT54_05570 [Candidatus Methanomethylophilaceae archaeon]|nr:hypothetical protein [Candidatus Methanomethylophilaceae archaeon]
MTFQKVGNDFGFENVDSEFSPFRELKIKWCRTMDNASFTVSDYPEEAPIEVIEGIARTIFSKIRAEEETGYPECAMGWLTSDGFRDMNQERYIERSRDIGHTGEAENERLWEAYRRLVDAGLIGEIKGLRLFWSNDKSVSKACQSSCLMRVVIMNRRLLGSEVPHEVLDYCLLHEIANISTDFGIDILERRKEVTDIMSEYPGKEIARNWLYRVMMEI